MKKLRTIFGILALAICTADAAAAAPSDLAGTEWGFPGEVGKSTRFIQFRSDAKVGGSTGCNRFVGSYSQDGYALTIGPLATTRRACLPEAMKREQQFLDVLSKVRYAEGTHLKLTLKDSNGTVLAELVRRDTE